MVVVIPALDEEEALPHVLADIPRERVDAVVVVNNGSSDRTAEVARAGGALVVDEPRRGYGRACLTGLEAVFGTSTASGLLPFEARGHDIIVFLDADYSDYPAELIELIEPIASERAEFVIGSRTLGGATMDALLPQAWFGNRLACFLMRLFFAANYTDLGPFRAIRCDALKHLDMGDEGYGWTVEMQLKAQVAGLRIVEVPVRYRQRLGRSKITGTLMGTLGAGYKILAWVLGWRLALWFNPRSIPKFREPGLAGSK